MITGEELVGATIKSFIIGGLISAFLTGVIVSTWVGNSTSNIYEKRAIEKGYAKKVIIDSITGETRFYWNSELDTLKIK